MGYGHDHVIQHAPCPNCAHLPGRQDRKATMVHLSGVMVCSDACDRRARHKLENGMASYHLRDAAVSEYGAAMYPWNKSDASRRAARLRLRIKVLKHRERVWLDIAFERTCELIAFKAATQTVNALAKMAGL